MAEVVDEGMEDGYEPLLAVTHVELWVAYREAVARRDQCLWAYVTLLLYTPTPSGCDSHWQLDLISDQVALAGRHHGGSGAVGSRGHRGFCA